MSCIVLSKWIVGLFNFALAVVGALIIYAGTTTMNNVPEWVSRLNLTSFDHNTGIETGKAINYIAIAVIVIGVFILVTALIGVFGAVFRNCCALVIFVIVLAVLTVILGAAGGVSMFIAVSNESKEYENKFISDSLRGYSWSEDKDANKMIDHTQFARKCCGIRNYTDWNGFRPESVDSTVYPFSCCGNNTDSKIADEDRYSCKVTNEDFFRDACLHEIKIFLNLALKIGITLLSITAVQALVIVLSYCILCSKNDDDKQYDAEWYAMHARDKPFIRNSEAY
ncbi:tetraspanin-1-like isoform X2 [Dinothrombium tinctorium]|uniref:Tetraspanin n=1 Tax=Dinothrombium tinctorium TaxID=1965070 RepID=A0A443QDZ0_9ACAR|nr:tetraspanin-1-like isoform X2 [Dinothrombium tinctorium]RWS01232.1 tetraspanin-1-like isoform X2 [Dinothrombium tinctorium]